MTNDNFLCIGKQLNFLNSLTDLEKKNVQDTSHLIKIKKGEVIFFEKDRLKQLYTICEGAFKFTFIDDDGKEHITKIVGKGDIIGRRSTITNKGALFTATAIADSILYTFDKKVILNSLENNNSFCQDVLKGFIMDAEDEAEKMSYFQNNRQIKIRLAGLLLYLSKKFGTEEKGWLNIALKRKDIANILGTTSEYIISLLSTFKKDNYLSIKKSKIKINSTKHLLALLKSN